MNSSSVIFLQSQDRFEDIMVMDWRTGEERFVKRSEVLGALESQGVSGSFGRIGGHCLMLYRLGGVLCFGLDDQRVRIDDEMSVSLSRVGDKNVFLIEKGGEVVVEFEYGVEDLYKRPIPGDTTAHVGEEDFDFCLFVNNVLNDRQRREFIY